MQVFDRNSDGFISKAELEQTFIDLGMKKNPFELNCIMQEADKNRDGKINYIGI